MHQVHKMADEIIRRDLPWREKPLAMKVFAILLTSAWMTGTVSMLVLGGIETVAQKQPKNPTSIYIHAHKLKCGIRYFTDTQERFFSLAMPMMIAGLTLFVSFGAGYEMLRRADYNRRLQGSFDHVGT